MATRESASDVLAIDLRRERKENILIVAEEAGEEAAAIDGLRLMPACWYLRMTGV